MDKKSAGAHNGRKEKEELPPVIRIEVRVLESLFGDIFEESKKQRVSPGRWIGIHLAEHFGRSEEDALPEPGAVGRPRKKLARLAK